jgi:HK97 family phage major capsid protein
MSELTAAVDELAGALESKTRDLANARRDLRAVADDIRHAAILGRQRESVEQKQYHGAFDQWLAAPDKGHTLQLQQCANDLSRKDVTLAVASGGGFALPKILADSIELYARIVNPWLDPAVLGAVGVGSSDYRATVTLSDASASRTTELGARGATGTPTFRERTPAWGTYFAAVTCSDWSRSDIPNLEDWLAREAGSQLGAQLALDIVAGTGSNGQALGFTTTTPSTVADGGSPLRAASALQYSPCSLATSPQRILLSDIELLLSRFAERYLLDPSFAFMMRPSTWRAVCAAGRSGTVLGVVDAAFTMRRPFTLYGYPVRLTSAMPAIAGDAFPIAAGAWRSAYALVTRGPMVIVVDDNITSPGSVKYYIRQRYGGTVLNNDSAKVLKYAAT